MWPTKKTIILALVAVFCHSVASEDLGLASLIDMIELEYEDQCNAKAETDWKELRGQPGSLNAKLELDKATGGDMKRNIDDLKVTSADFDANSPGNQLLNRKLELLLTPGDALLEIDQWNRLVSFADEAVHKLEKSRDYNCGNDPNEPCTLSDVRRQLANKDVSDGARKRIRASWEKKLPNVNDYITQILPLLTNASKANGYDSVERYWESLLEYEGGVEKARELWSHVQPLYEKLQRHVGSRLRAAGLPLNTDLSIPVRSLGSLLGEDWLNVAEFVLPTHSDIFNVILKNLRRKNMGGREAFIKASKMIEELKLGSVSPNFWINSLFNESCPTKLVDFCVSGNVNAFTCSDISLGNYLDAHEDLMKVKYKEIEASYSNNTFILREARRYSAVYEAISGLGSLLALTRYQLDRSKLVPMKYFERNTDHNKIVLQMIMALRDLPRLVYYLAADDWRLKTLRQFPAPIPFGDSWTSYRRTFSLVEPGDKDFLGDPHILNNRPYLANFFGVILKYQIYQSFDDYSGDSDILYEITNNQHRILEPMTRAFSVKWPELVSDIVAKKEYGVDYSGILDYFSLLNDYLEKQNDPTNEITDNYEFPDESDLFEATSETQPIEIEDEVSNEIDHIGALEINEHEKEDIRANVENVQANKHLIPKEELQQEEQANFQKKDNAEGINSAGTNNIYLWIGIGIVLAIIVILVGIIVKKRINNRNQLERERKQQSKA